MSAIETIEIIQNNKDLINASFKYCLVDANKLPYKIDNNLAHPNKVEDFVEFNDLLECKNLNKYKGVGISIQASNISAIDVDKCFSDPFNINSIDQRGQDVINLFKDKAYIEFSFSGTGMRILFNSDVIKDYSNFYYIKNDKFHCEFYQPTGSARYVTLTGKTIQPFDLALKFDINDTLKEFLDKYLKKSNFVNVVSNISPEDLIETKSLDQLLKIVKNNYLKDYHFQSLWFDTAHNTDLKGASLESNKDYAMLIYIFNNITKNKIRLKELFEASPYFKTKDQKHVNKWNYNNFRYFNYIYNQLLHSGGLYESY